MEDDIQIQNVLQVSDNVTVNSCDCVQGVRVRNASKSYGVGKRRNTVLDGLDMTVKKGSIYGLLGPSGCGKTTLLSCIVGRRSLDSGQVLVFGDEPNGDDSGIPGPRVGYMPQELALYGEFTIRETIEYFGRIYKLSPTFVKTQIETLSKLLDLPPSHRFVKTLSGGQQRRVSFTIALFHEPDLLILDEPTVGVDPLLRQSIWNYLGRQSTEYGRTVIITTHYIEEARQADTIGLMRSGRLLIEESPKNLLTNFRATNLESVFLKLCIKDVESRRNKVNNRSGIENTTTRSESEPQASHTASTDCNVGSIVHLNDDATSPDLKNTAVNPTESLPHNFINANENAESLPGNSSRCVCFTDTNYKAMQSRPSFLKSLIPSSHRSSALIRKNFMHTFRNFTMFFIIFFLPTLQAILFCLAIGHDPKSLRVAIVNEELDPLQNGVCDSYTANCTRELLSCRYLNFLGDMIQQEPFQTVAEALNATKDGKVWGVVHFAANFSENLVSRHFNGSAAGMDAIVGSRIGIMMDSSNQQISFFLQNRLSLAFESFAGDILRACDYDPVVATMPLTFLDPIYGEKNPLFSDFMAPGVIITIVYFMAIALTTGSIISERKQGLLDRSLVAGVRLIEFFLAHLVNQFTVLVSQTALVFIFMLTVFNTPCIGNLGLAVLITLLQGLCGMCFGLLVSSSCDSEMGAIQLSMGVFLPTLLFSGSVWPLEGMLPILRYVSYAMPQTYAIEALRSIFLRGWGIDMPDVYWGLLITFGWSFLLLTMSIVVARVRKYTG